MHNTYWCESGVVNRLDIINIINDHNDCYTQIIKSKHRDFYDDVCKRYSGDKFGEKLYRYLYNGDKLGVCKNCGSRTKFKSVIIGYAAYCGKRCSNEHNRNKISETRRLNAQKNKHRYVESKSCVNCNSIFESYKFRNRKFCSIKCSSISTGCDVNRLSKIKDTKLKRYGDSNYVNSSKARKTCLDRYGVDNIFKFREIKDLIREINLQKYGVECTFQSGEIKQKIKQTVLNRYGVDNPSKAENVKDKRKKTISDKYGVDNIFKHKETMEKVYVENIKKYGKKIPVNGEELKSLMIKRLKETLYETVVERLNNKSECTALFTVEEYVNTDKENKYKFQCKKCCDIFYDHIDGGHLPRCLKCNPYIAGFSLHEKEIVDYIKSITNDDVIENTREVLNGLELDLYIPSKNIAIEYDGLYWHSEKGGGKNKHYHLNKTELCKSKGIQLIHIFEDEWTYKRDIVKSKLKHILNYNSEKPIYARSCEIREIESVEQFLKQNHIQGNCPAQIKLGAYYNGELVAVMTFGKRRVALGTKSINDNEYELLRFATSRRITGIASKLLNYFIKLYNPVKIVTYADRRYSVGSLYKKIGFNEVGVTQPNYWYFIDGGNKLWHRFNFRKDTLDKKFKNYDKNLTEWENMKNNGYDRIWDCGNIKYEIIIQ